jgi:GTPase SAR1 family protein
MPLKVSVMGDRFVGKRTFLTSLSLTETSPNVYSLNVNDIKNNVQTVFNFKHVDLENASDIPWLKESVCVILLFDISRQESFQLATGRLLDEARNQIHETWSFIMLIGNKLDLEDNRQVETEEAQDCAQNQGFLFNEVSSINRKKIELVLRMLRTRTSQMIAKHQAELRRPLHLSLEQFAASHIPEDSNRFYGMHEYNRSNDEDEFQKIVNLNKMYSGMSSPSSYVQ